MELTFVKEPEEGHSNRLGRSLGVLTSPPPDEPDDGLAGDYLEVSGETSEPSRQGRSRVLQLDMDGSFGGLTGESTDATVEDVPGQTPALLLSRDLCEDCAQ